MEKHERLRSARITAGYSSAAEADRRLGVSYGTYSGHENGLRGIKDRDLIRYAKAFGVSASFLIFGEKDINYELNMLNAIGFAGHLNDGEVQMLDHDDQEGAMYLPGIAPPNSGYIRVKGNLIRGIAEEGWLIICDVAGSPPEPKYFEQLCICRTDDNKHYCKTLYPSASTGIFDLASPMQPLIRNAKVSSVYSVYSVITGIFAEELYRRNRLALDAMSLEADIFEG